MDKEMEKVKIIEKVNQILKERIIKYEIKFPPYAKIYF